MFSMRKLFGLFLLTPVMLASVSCSEAGGTKETKAEETPVATAKTTKAKSAKQAESKYVLPSPMEIASLIQKTGINYTEGTLNPIERVEFYTTNYTKALNLGVYGADLGLILVFDQTQDAINYFTTVKTLAEELGVLSAFPQTILNRVEANLGNRDSLLDIAGNAFADADMYLKENERNQVSALILAGGWIEALYLSTKFSNDGENKDICQRVGEQQKSLDVLIELISNFKDVSEGYGVLYAQLEDLKSTFSKVKITYTEGPVITKDRQTIIQRKSNVEISAEVFDEIADKVKTIREQLVN